MKIIYFLSFFLLNVVSFVYGQKKIEFNAKYAVDASSSWNIANVGEKSFRSYHVGERIDIGYNDNTTVWCVIRMKNSNQLNGTEAWLSFDNNHIDSLVIYEEKKLVGMLGDRTAHNSPFLTALAFRVKLGPGQEKVYYVSVKKEISALNFSFKLVERDSLARESDVKVAVISFFMGVVFLLILFNTLLLFITRKKLFLFYILYSVLSVLYVLVSTNYAKHLLFPDFLFFSELRIYVAFFWVIALSAFLSHYLSLKKLEPIKYNIIVGVSVFNFCFIVITVVLLILGKLDLIKEFMLLGYFNFLVALGLMAWSAVLHLKINRPAAVYVILAFLPQNLWGLCFILNFFRIISTDVHVDWLMYCCLYEVLLFGYVLTKNYIDTFQKNNGLIKEITLEKERSLQAITQVQIRERRSIANIIHDNFGSKLAYVLQLIQLKNIALAEENIKILTSDIREISHQILPKSLDEGALVSSLKSQVLSLNVGLGDAKIDLFSYDFPERLDEVWIYDLYLISLEIINNSLKHGDASSIIIELYGYPDAYVFQYSDDGKGFDLSHVAKGFGLENIEKRVRYYKGDFEINSTPGEGTVVQIIIPIQ
jgi:signal transduction histidine kinase